MIRHLAIFIATFAIGVLLATVLRTATHDPYASTAPGAGDSAQAGTASSASAPMATPADAPRPVSAPASTPADMPPMPANPAPASTPATPAHPTHEHTGEHTGKATNTTCPICGMPVDPRLGTIDFNGHAIGFGCATCPAKFRADPAKYGPAALRNEVAD